MDTNPTPSTFTLRRLELAMPFTKAMQEGDPKAMVNLAAIILADESSLKIYAAGNTEVLGPFVDQVHARDPFEVAALLANFTADSARFSSLLSGLPAELLDQLEARKRAKIVASLLPAESPAPLADTRQP
jgi:hypothetical protein